MAALFSEKSNAASLPCKPFEKDKGRFNMLHLTNGSNKIIQCTNVLPLPESQVWLLSG
jgi:hypothetical protein